MAGTREGGLKTAVKNMAKDPDFYKKLGAKGGRKSRGGGFAYTVACECSEIQGMHSKARCAGKKGGRAGKRASKLVADK